MIITCRSLGPVILHLFFWARLYLLNVCNYMFMWSKLIFPCFSMFRNIQVMSLSPVCLSSSWQRASMHKRSSCCLTSARRRPLSASRVYMSVCTCRLFINNQDNQMELTFPLLVSPSFLVLRWYVLCKVTVTMVKGLRY